MTILLAIAATLFKAFLALLAIDLESVVEAAA